jgi:uncharacterized protein (DUF169 family)
MSDFRTMAQDLAASLELKYAPVGVTLYGEADPLPPDVPVTGENLKSYCQALALAGLGRTFLLRKEQMGCKLGTAVLGFEKGQELAAFLDDGVLEKYGVGLFASEEASAATIRQAAFLEAGKTQAVFIAPLGAFKEPPQVVAFTANSEQVMWLLYAVNYDRGGKMDLPQSGGALGGCSDITVFPLLQGMANVTFLGLGCRLKAALDPCHLMLGIPGNLMEPVHTHILDMAKPIAMLRKARTAV